MKNKKAGEKLLSLWWFIVIAIIAGGIGIGVMLYFSAEVNTNAIESDILAEKISRCLVDNGNLIPEVFEENFDIFNRCGLDKRAFEKGSNFYFKIIISNDTVIKKISFGDDSFEKDCEVGSKINAKHFPKCSSRVENVLYDEKLIKVSILTGSNQKGGKNE